MTEAATAKEMSIPPATRTTSKPTPKMISTALVLSRSNMFENVRNVCVVRLRPMTIRQSTTISHRSVAPTESLGMDGPLDRVHIGPTWHILVDDATVLHVENAIRIEVGLRDFVRNQKNSHAGLSEPVNDREDAGARADIDTDGRR